MQGIVKLLLLHSLMLLTAQEIRAGEKSDHLAVVNIRSTLEELSDFRTGYLYLVVENLSDTLLVVDSIRVADPPEFIRIQEPSQQAQPDALEQPACFYPSDAHIRPGESRIYTFAVEADGQLQPGKHLLLFNVLYHGWRTAESKADTLSGPERILQNGGSTVSHEIDVQVFGEKEVLGAFSNAFTFLVLPGFIIVVTTGMFWDLFGRLRPDEFRDNLPEWIPGWSKGMNKLVDPRFWVVAIMCSLLMAVVFYPLLTQLTPYGKREYLYGYGFHDIVLIWGFSIGIGIAAASLGSFACILWYQGGLLKKKREYEQSIKGDEAPLTLLEKALDNGLSESRLTKALVKASDKKGFLIEKDVYDKTMFWVIPGIKVVWQADANDLYSRFEDEMYSNKPLSVLLEIIREGMSLTAEGKGILEVVWDDTSDTIEKPLQLKKDEYEQLAESQYIFFVEMSE